MKMSAIIIFGLLMAAMFSLAQPTNMKPANAQAARQAQSLTSTQLTSAQATALAIRLANDKADALFHHRPFKDGQPAQLTATGKWVWTDGCGVALLDYHVSVKLAVDGSTNSVDVQVWDDSVRPLLFRSVPGFPIGPGGGGRSLP